MHRPTSTSGLDSKLTVSSLLQRRDSRGAFAMRPDVDAFSVGSSDDDNLFPLQVHRTP